MFPWKRPIKLKETKHRLRCQKKKTSSRKPCPIKVQDKQPITSQNSNCGLGCFPALNTHACTHRDLIQHLTQQKNQCSTPHTEQRVPSDTWNCLHSTTFHFRPNFKRLPPTQSLKSLPSSSHWAVLSSLNSQSSTDKNTPDFLLKPKTSASAFAYVFILLQENQKQLACFPLHCEPVTLLA